MPLEFDKPEKKLVFDQPSEEEQLPFVARQAQNVIPSAGRALGDLASGVAQMVTSPIETAKGLGRVVGGGLQKIGEAIYPEDEISQFTNKDLIPHADAVIDVFDYWCAKRAKVLPPSDRRPKATPGRLSKVSARLADGYTLEELKKAVDGCLGNKFNVDGGHLDLELICRDEKHVDQYMALARKAGNGSGGCHMTAADVAAWDAAE